MRFLPCRSGGILPLDTTAQTRERLRRERQADYQEYLRSRQCNVTATSHKPNSTSSTRVYSDYSDVGVPSDIRGGSKSVSSVSEKRWSLAKEREEELVGRGSSATLERAAWKEGGRMEGRPSRRREEPPALEAADVCHFNHHREHRLEEERRYGGHFHESLSPTFGDRSRGRLEERVGARRGRAKDEGGERQVRFDGRDENMGVGGVGRRGEERRRKWDEEEEDLVQWARGQGRSRGTIGRKPRTRTPPLYAPPPRKQTMKESRSISAPVIAGGITALGAGEGLESKRRRQREYAEQLEAQMREREEAKARERRGERGKQVSAQGWRDEERGSTRDLGGREGGWYDSYRSQQRDERSKVWQEEQHNPRRERPLQRNDLREAPHNVGPYSYPHPPTQPSSSYHPMPASWPHPYYTGYPYPPPSYLPPPSNGYPYYAPPPPPHLPPPAMANPYLPYYQPTAREHEPSSTSSRLRQGRENREEPTHRLTRDSDRERDYELDSFPSGSEGRIGGGRNSKITKEAYRAQLVEQMREKRDQRERERIKREELKGRKEQEIYDPFGKGGCGAPIRDGRGKLVTDLKKMKKINDEKQLFGLPSTTPLPGEKGDAGGCGVLNDSLTSEESAQESSHDVRRSREAQDRAALGDYRDALEKQMREKEEVKRREKEKKMQEEKLEGERIEREMKELQDKYQREKEREKERQYDLKLKNEVMQREKEEMQRKEEERKWAKEWQEQERLQREAEERKQALIDKMEREVPHYAQPRPNSPPIPTLRKKTDGQSTTEPSHHPQIVTSAPLSPPVPALQHRQQLGHALPAQGQRHPLSHATTVDVSQQQQQQLQQQQQQQLQQQLEPQQQQRRQWQQQHWGPSYPPEPTLTKKLFDETEEESPTTSFPPPPARAAPTHHSQNLPTPAAGSAVQGEGEEDEEDGRRQQLPEEKMETMVKHFQRMRQMLERERQKVAVHSMPAPPIVGPLRTVHPPQSLAGPSTSGAGQGTSGFRRPRLVAPRRNTATKNLASAANGSGVYMPSPAISQQHQQQKQWLQGGAELRDQFPEPLQSQSFPLLHAALQDAPLPPSRRVGKENTAPWGTLEATANTSQWQQDNQPPTPGPQPEQCNKGLPRGALLASWLAVGRGGDTNSDPRQQTQQQLRQMHRASSAGAHSQFSVATVDVNSMVQRNEERMQRLEAILNTQAAETREPETILSNLMAGRNSRTDELQHQPARHTQPPSVVPHLTMAAHSSGGEVGGRRDAN